jgi:hypothetical protein
MNTVVLLLLIAAVVAAIIALLRYLSLRNKNVTCAIQTDCEHFYNMGYSYCLPKDQTKPKSGTNPTVCSKKAKPDDDDDSPDLAPACVEMLQRIAALTDMVTPDEISKLKSAQRACQESQ